MHAAVGRITYISFIASPIIYPETPAGSPIVRRAMPADLPGIGRPGVLLVEEHNANFRAAQVEHAAIEETSNHERPSCGTSLYSRSDCRANLSQPALTAGEPREPQ
jgi:hypothetical protein